MGIETIAALGLAAMAANQIGSSMSESSARDAQSGAIKNAQGQIGAYRPEMAKAMQQGAMNRSGALQGTNNVLASMYGSGASGAPAGLTNNPMAQVFGQGVQPPQPGTMGAAMGPPPQMRPGAPGMASANPGAMRLPPQPSYPGAPPTVSADPLAGRR